MGGSHNDAQTTVWVLGIGIDEYQLNGIKNLEGCAKDVYDLCAALSRRFKAVEPCILTNSSATVAATISSFRTHLIDNLRISMGDPIVVMLACYGQRLDGGPKRSREVDAFIPSDYSSDVPGIPDHIVHSLLVELVEKKGPNVTIIIDSCFSRNFPGATNARRLRGPQWRSHLLNTEIEDHQFGGFFSGQPQPYVLLMACRQDSIAQESSDGGLFTQALVYVLGDSEETSMTYRELVIMVNAKIGAVHCPVIPHITKLAVYLNPLFQLEADPDDNFFLVSSKNNATVALRPGPNDAIIIEQLRGFPARYGSREVVLHATESTSISRVLTGIAFFHHCFALGLQSPTDITWYRGWLRYLVFWRPRVESQADIAVHHFAEAHNASPSLISANLSSIRPWDHVLGLKLSNSSKRVVYPYLFHFDSATYAIKANVKLRPTTLEANSSITLGYGENGGPSFRVTVDPNNRGRSAELLKVIFCQKPVDLEYMRQDSPLTPSSKPSPPPCAPIIIPEPWYSDVVVISVPPGYRSEQPSVRDGLSLVWSRLRRVTGVNLMHFFSHE
ncbi:caspase domain-containing protein [Mycena haematopus]|nr:caspase domain-containing protein [Mycena haematopus]